MKFEDYINQHQERLESMEPSISDWEAIARQLPAQSMETTSDRRRMWMYILIVIGLLIILLSSGLLWSQHQEKQEQWLHAQQQMDHQLDEIQAMLSQKKTSSRIKAINRVSMLEDPAEQIPNMLLQTVQSDPSLNVKFAALNALESYAHLEEVRIGLIQLLMQSQDQKLKVRMVSFLSEIQEGRIESYLEDIIDDQGNSSMLKQEAGVALERIKKL